MYMYMYMYLRHTCLHTLVFSDVTVSSLVTDDLTMISSSALIRFSRSAYGAIDNTNTKNTQCHVQGVFVSKQPDMHMHTHAELTDL